METKLSRLPLANLPSSDDRRRASSDSRNGCRQTSGGRTNRRHPLLFDSASRLASERVEERFRGKSASRIPALDSRSAPHLTIRSCFPPYGYPPPHPLHCFPASCLSPPAAASTLSSPSDAPFGLITFAFGAVIPSEKAI